MLGGAGGGEGVVEGVEVGWVRVEWLDLASKTLDWGIGGDGGEGEAYHHRDRSGRRHLPRRRRGRFGSRGGLQTSCVRSILGGVRRRV